MLTSGLPTSRGGAPKTGLVLSGGGALGAYHAGVVRALSKLGVPVHMVSGASVGALNGAVVAAAPSLDAAADQLEDLWRTLGSQSALEPHVPGWFQLLMGMGMRGVLLGRAIALLGAAIPFAPVAGILTRIQGELRLFSDGPVRRALEHALTERDLASGLPLFVSVFRSRGGQIDLLSGIAKVLEFDTAPSEFLHVQALPPADQHEAILASAALPLVFGSRKVGAHSYVDGGIGGGTSCQGNTPAAPLVEAGCTHLVVSHLSEATLWDRGQYPGVQIVEIALQETIGRDGGLKDLLHFDERKSDFLINRGYEDCMASVGRLQALFQMRRNAAEADRNRSTALLSTSKAVGHLDGDAFDRHFKSE